MTPPPPSFLALKSSVGHSVRHFRTAAFRLAGTLFLAALWLLTSVLSARDVTCFIAENGSDSAAGTQEAPFATLSRALSEVRTACASGGVEHAAIYFRGGRYFTQKNHSFANCDFSGLQAPLLISNWQDEPVTLLGGVPLRDWKDEGNGQFSAPVPDFIQEPEKLTSLCFDDSSMTWARWPNLEPEFPYSGGWAYVDGKPFGMYVEVPDEPLNSILMRESVRWSHPERGWVLIFPRHNWSNDLTPITSLDPKTRTLTAARNFRFAARPMDRYCVYGMPEELDAPGEWVVIPETRRLLFIPPKGTTPEKLETSVTLAVTSAILQFSRCKNVTIHGLTLTASSGNAIQINDCSGITVEKCVIHDVGFRSGAGVECWHGERCSVFGCDIYRTASAGVSMEGGDIYGLKSSENCIENNYFHHTGTFMRGGGGVSVSGCGARVAHNLGHDFPRGPISVTGVRNVIEFNHFHHANMESEDTGLIYLNGAGTWINGRGSIIRFNHFSDNIGFGHKNGVYQFFMFSWGIYLDDTSADIKVYGNLVERCTIGCVHLHNARENEIFNNIFVDGGSQQFQLSGWTNDPNARMMKRHIDDMTRNYERAIQNPEWRKMRDMQSAPRDTFLPDGTSMRGNHIERNIFWYPNQPKSAYVKFNAVNFDFNSFRKNVIWNGTDAKPVTGMAPAVLRSLGSFTTRIPNFDFTRTKELKTPAIPNFPEGWKFFMSPLPPEQMKAEIPEPGTLRLYAAYNSQKPHIQHAVVRSEQFELPWGQAYRLSCKIRRKDGPASLYVLADGPGFWNPFKRITVSGPTDGEFHEYSTTFRIPAKGDPDFDERMTTFSLLFSNQSQTAEAELKDVQLEAVEIGDEWQSWNLKGQDQESVLADPLFVDAGNGDYRLKPESPALKLGFEPIPFEKIGPYADPRRASWPIQEADGIRNHPEWLRVPPTIPTPENH